MLVRGIVMQRDNSVEWKNIPGFDARYFVSDDGRVWSRCRNKYLSLTSNKSDGYIRVSLYSGVHLVHRLVAISFLGERSNRQVNHIDGNKKNNNVNNLEWVTASENATHSTYNLTSITNAHKSPSHNLVKDLYLSGKYSYSKLAKMFNVSKTTIASILGTNGKDTKRLKQFAVLENEIVEQIPDFPHYFASNFGRILSLKSGRALTLQIQPNGYVKVDLKENGKHYRKYVHRLVCAALLGKSKLVVNHKDKDKTNNNLSNLEYVTQSENIKHSVKRKINEDDYEKIYTLKLSGKSSVEIARIYNVTKGHINVICRKYKSEKN